MTWKLTGTVLWGLLVAGVFLGLQVGTAIVAGPRGDGYVLAVSTLVTTLVCVPVLFGIARLKKGSDLRDYFALRPVAARTLARWALITVPFLVLSDGLTYLLGKPIVPDFMRLITATADPLWLLWLALILGAPVFEEAFFRGFLFTGFAASTLGPIGAIVATSALWAAVHQQYDLYGMVTLFVLGALFGLARLRTGSIYVPVALHAMTNVVAAAEAALIG